MAEIKTLIVQVPEISSEAGQGSLEVLTKGTLFENYEPGPVLEALDQGLDQGQTIVQTLSEAILRLEKGQELTYLELKGPQFDQELFELIDKSDRRTVMALLSGKSLAFYGLGISPKKKSTTQASYRDVLPTLAQVGEFYLSQPVRGAVLFEALKNPNYKQSQIGKLKAALERLEKMLKRGNQEPWDKHDCA
jgi:hypothetical protein